MNKKHDRMYSQYICLLSQMHVLIDKLLQARKGDLGQNLRQILCMPYFRLQSYTFCQVLAKTMYD